MIQFERYTHCNRFESAKSSIPTAKNAIFLESFTVSDQSFFLFFGLGIIG